MWMLLLAALFAGGAGAGPSGAASIAAARDGEHLVLRALFAAESLPRQVGADAPAAELTYALDVTKSGTSGRSTSRQAGRFTPQAGRTDTLSTVRLGVQPGDEVDARLIITGPGGVLAETEWVETIR